MGYLNEHGDTSCPSPVAHEKTLKMYFNMVFVSFCSVDQASAASPQVTAAEVAGAHVRPNQDNEERKLASKPASEQASQRASEQASKQAREGERKQLQSSTLRFPEG